MSDKIFLAALGAAIKLSRIKQGLAQQELAALCNFEKASMSRIEAGLTNPTVLTLRRISQALTVPVSSFFI